MLGVVLPATTCISAAIAAPNAGIAVTTADARVSVEIIIVVDGDVIVTAPAAVPPSATPSGTRENSFFTFGLHCHSRIAATPRLGHCQK